MLRGEKRPREEGNGSEAPEEKLRAIIEAQEKALAALQQQVKEQTVLVAGLQKTIQIAYQDARRQIDDLKKKVDELEERVAELEPALLGTQPVGEPAQPEEEATRSPRPGGKW